eukprot:gene2022-2205_t
MSKKSILRGVKGQEHSANNTLVEELLSPNSSDEEENQEFVDASHGGFPSEDGSRKKSRIPWDRDPRGDKNGLKLALLTLIHDHKYHIEGKYMDNFRDVATLLSQPGSVFERYQGIEPSGAQRKFNQIVKEVAKTFALTESGEFQQEQEASGFEILALSMIKDMVNREKEKNARRQSRTPGKAIASPSSPVPVPRGNVGPQGTTLLRKRKSDIIPLKTALRKFALTDSFFGDQEGTEGVNAGYESPVDSAANARVEYSVHKVAIQRLKERFPDITQVDHVLKAAEISSSSIASFATTTQVKMEKPVDRILVLYEEIMSERDYVSKAKLLLGLGTADALELDAFLRPLYDTNK